MFGAAAGVSVLTAITALALTSACGTDSPRLECHCPAGVFGIQVPADRVDDVESVTAMGGCGNVSGGGEQFFVEALEDGTCHVAIEFKSGAPEFDADVPLAHCTDGACCSSCAPLAAHGVIVPELSAATQ